MGVPRPQVEADQTDVGGDGPPDDDTNEQATGERDVSKVRILVTAAEAGVLGSLKN